MKTTAVLLLLFVLTFAKSESSIYSFYDGTINYNSVNNEKPNYWGDKWHLEQLDYVAVEQASKIELTHSKDSDKFYLDFKWTIIMDVKIRVHNSEGKLLQDVEVEDSQCCIDLSEQDRGLGYIFTILKDGEILKKYRLEKGVQA